MLSKHCLAIGSIVAAFCGAAHAEIVQTDVEVGGRVLSFLSPPLTGEIKVSVVYAPGNPASAADEKAVLALLGSGLKVGNVTLQPVAVDIDKVGGVADGVVLLTGGLGADGAKVAAVLKAKKLVCMTTDLAAVQSGFCSIHLKSAPKVQITVNKSLDDAIGLSFGAAFKLMITEI
jgi:hypothetical protein